MSLREKVLKGVAWSAMANIGAQAISFVVFLVLARLLEPEAFGLVAMAYVFVALLNVFVDQGLGQAIVQRENLEPAHLDATFWFNILIGTLLTLGGMLFSGVVADLYKTPEIGPIVRWFSISFILMALSSTQQAILQRDLRYKSLAVRSLVAKSTGGGIAIVAALLGYGLWSLVIQAVVNNLIAAIVLWRVSSWRPRFLFSWQHFKDLYGFSVNIFGLNLMNFANNRLDDFLIGLFLGPTVLGYYSVAYRILRMLAQLLMGITAPVSLSAFSRLQQQPERLRNAFYQSVKYTSFIAFPVVFGIVALAPELITVVFGSRWLPSIPVMQILPFAVLLSSILIYNTSLLKAVGKPHWVLGITMVATLVNVIGFFLVVEWGIIAVAAVFAFARYPLAPIYFWLVHRTVRLEPKLYCAQFVAPIVAGGVMCIVIIGLKALLSGSTKELIALIIYLVAGAAVYLGTFHLLSPSTISQAASFFRANPKK